MSLGCVETLREPTPPPLCDWQTSQACKILPTPLPSVTDKLHKHAKYCPRPSPLWLTNFTSMQNTAHAPPLCDWQTSQACKILPTPPPLCDWQTSQACKILPTPPPLCDWQTSQACKILPTALPSVTDKLHKHAKYCPHPSPLWLTNFTSMQNTACVTRALLYRTSNRRRIPKWLCRSSHAVTEVFISDRICACALGLTHQSYGYLRTNTHCPGSWDSHSAVQGQCVGVV